MALWRRITSVLWFNLQTTPWGTCLKHNETSGWSHRWRFCLSKQLLQKGFAHIYKCFLRGSLPGSSVFLRLFPPLLFIFSVFSAQWNQIPAKINPSCDYRPNIILKMDHSWGASWKRKLSRFRVLLGFLSEKRWRRLCRRAQMTAAVRGKYERKIE